MNAVFSKSPLAIKLLVGSISVAALTMTGCATKPTYQNTRNAGPQIVTNGQGVPNYHLVKRGDTVSDIASRYRLNYRQIGAMNNLDSKYTIYSGQWLKLWQGGENAQRAPNRTTTSSNNQYNTQYSSAGNNPNNGPAANTPIYSSNNSTTATPVYEATANSTSGYAYPSNNQVVRNFDAASGNMGMWFAGKVGDPVMASQGGTVLYSGNGLAEYGNLIMIRHSDNYITAYAHNSQLLVKEGEQVQSGQRIAAMGNSGQTNQVGLEFQVRLNGNPIDPRSVLGR